VASVEEAVLALALRAGLVVAKMGPDGAVAAEGERLIHLPAPSIDAVDTTGAGDSFDAGFLSSWLAGDPVEQALALANACGAISTQALGGVDAQPTMEEALALVTEHAG
jgi:sugar/nucleoside kinase (ribokinase family)